MDIISLLLTLVVIAAVAWALFAIVGLIPLPEPFGQIARIIIGLIILLWVISVLASLLGHGPGFGIIRLR